MCYLVHKGLRVLTILLNIFTADCLPHTEEVKVVEIAILSCTFLLLSTVVHKVCMLCPLVRTFLFHSC